MKLISRKASDAEIGLAQKRLDHVLAVWELQWGFKTLEDLPEYVQDAYIIMTHSMWLEEQVAILREELKNDNIRTSGSEDKASDNEGSDRQSRISDQEVHPEPVVVHQPSVVTDKTIPHGGEERTEVRFGVGDIQSGNGVEK